MVNDTEIDRSEEQWLEKNRVVSHDRTVNDEVRFFGSIAKEHGIRLSALVFHIVAWTRNKRKRYQTPYEYDTVARFGKALGIAERQTRKLLHEARAAGFLNFRRSLRCVKVWVEDESLYKLKGDDTFKYSRRIARKVGINGAVFLAKIEYHEQEEGSFAGSYKRFAKRFPWVTECAAKCVLRRLLQVGYLSCEDTRESYHGQCRYFVTRKFVDNFKTRTHTPRVRNATAQTAVHRWEEPCIAEHSKAQAEHGDALRGHRSAELGTGKDGRVKRGHGNASHSKAL